MVNWDSSFSETHWETQRKPKTDGRTAIQTEEWDEERRVNDERRTSRRLRTTMSAHHVVFPPFSSSVCPPHPALLQFLLFSLMFFSIFLCCYFSPLPLLLSVCVFLSSLGHTPFFTSLFLQLSLCSFALVLSVTLLSFLFLDLSLNSAQLEQQCISVFSHRFCC